MRAPHACLLASAFAMALGACALQTETASQASPPAHPAPAVVDPLEQDARALFAGLTPAQRAKALLAFDDPRRNEVIFPGEVRAGIPIMELDPAQQVLAHTLIRDFTSPTGLAQADQIIHQATPDALKRYYLTYFGEPIAGKAHAWRIAVHHLTLVDVEVNEQDSVSVGPILLGSNPPEFFETEENNLIALYASLSPEERIMATRPLSGVSGEALVLATAVPVWKLSQAAQKKLATVVDQRLSFYSATIQKRIRSILDDRGGLSAMHMSFYGLPDKRCKDGGKWDWKLGGPTILLDYENSRGHIHTSLKAAMQRPGIEH